MSKKKNKHSIIDVLFLYHCVNRSADNPITVKIQKNINNLIILEYFFDAIECRIEFSILTTIVQRSYIMRICLFSIYIDDFRKIFRDIFKYMFSLEILNA